MFDPQRLLGQLMGDALSGQLGGKRRKGRSGPAGMLGGLLGGSSRGMSTGTKATIGVGLLGLAVAAYQHYNSSQNAGQGQPAASAGFPPPAPPPMSGHAAPPPPPPAAATPVRTEQAMHLLRAMITAAHADGLIDDGERNAILGRARDAGLDAESLQALDAEIRAPLTLEQLTARTPATLRDEVYAAALVAITADTEDERRFLDRLAGQLQLDDAARRDIHAQLGLA